MVGGAAAAAVHEEHRRRRTSLSLPCSLAAAGAPLTLLELTESFILAGVCLACPLFGAVVLRGSVMAVLGGLHVVISRFVTTNPLPSRLRVELEAGACGLGRCYRIGIKEGFIALVLLPLQELKVGTKETRLNHFKARILDELVCYV
ncbi:hypothetical protein PIB30_022964 [Stylosanthes scabra]|uniref:GPI-GlcNAc transferase complex PIG-H component conserved domain-containing protein n=1 Tax=Stylosanthes scabra TaxID=79078 RepID=A0ABU6S9H4_9FABA|nr:hypothetical protein [Stylosanthes scabra]